MILGTLLLPHTLHLLNTCPPRAFRNALAANRILRVPHAGVDVDVLESDEQRAVGGVLEPTVDLPAQVQEDKQRPGEVELEESFGVEVGAADGVQGDVELGDEGDDVDQDADVRAGDAETRFVGEFVEGVAIRFPGGLSVFVEVWRWSCASVL